MAELLRFRQAVLKEVQLMVRTPINVTNEQLLARLKDLSKDYRRLRGFDSGGE